MLSKLYEFKTLKQNYGKLIQIGYKMKIGFLHSLIRKDEKFLLQEFEKIPDIELDMIDDRKLIFNLAKNQFDHDVVIVSSFQILRRLRWSGRWSSRAFPGRRRTRQRPRPRAAPSVCLPGGLRRSDCQRARGQNIRQHKGPDDSSYRP